ncbi:MAG: hypothetical protein Q8K02_09325, partial [Flavobacterium sp.]|nr:hypothetical protein [Flavobacterium sp.]
MSSLKATPLFRFVHHRSPELYSEFEQEQKFIMRPEFEDPYLLAVRQNPEAERWSLLASVVLPEVYSIDVLKEFSLYAFSQWLAKHKHDVTTTELLERMQKNYDFNDVTRIALKPVLSSDFLDPLTETNRRALWTQLIYQVVHQESLYAKEIIIQLLFADHVVRTLIKDISVEKIDSLNKIILGAKVVLPNDFFNGVHSSNTARKSEDFKTKRVMLHSTSEQVLKNDAVHELQTQINTLKKELQRADAVYQNAYQKAKDQYDKQYEREVTPLIKQHQADYDRELRKWCDLLPTNQEYNPLDPCKQPPYLEEPNYPDYSFSYPYPDDRFYIEHLSEDSYAFLTSFQRNSAQYRPLPSMSPISLSPIADFEVNDFNTYPSPGHILPTFNDLIDNLTPIVQPLPGHQTPVVATPTGPLLLDVQLLEPYHYRLFASMRGDKLQLNFFIGLPQTGYDLSEFQITAENQNSSLNFTSQQVLNKNIEGNLLSFRNPLNAIITQSTLPSYQQFKGTVSFNAEDVVYDFGFTQEQLSSIITTNQEVYFELTGVLTVRSDGDSDGVAVFVPSGFGMKDIGIADYNRVEQSTYCYVEGDVQHIENIMAREFKEMSTRRFLGKTTSQTDRTETESEQLSELNTSNRFEMHNEISQVLGSSRDFQTNLGLNTKFGGKGGSPEVTISSQTGFASHQSVENSSHQAVTQSKEVTERALERVVNKVMQERTQTIVEEFEENNSHGFDNRKGDEHVVGVYRWVDKVVKNQVINYGKRQMLEFMIPQPSKLYRFSKTNDSLDNENLILMPKDPRKEIGNFMMKTQNDVNDSRLAYWAAIYNVELPKKPEATLVVSHAFEGKDPNFTGKDDGKIQMVVGTGDFEIPEDYVAKKIHYRFMTSRRGFLGVHRGRLTIAGFTTIDILDVNEGSSSGTILTSGTNALKNKVFYSFETSESPIIHG